MSFKRSLFFLAILAAIGGYIWKVELPREDAEERAELALGGLGRKDIQEVEVKASSGVVTLEAPSADAADSGDKWSIKGMSTALLDAGAVNALLSAVESTKLENKIPAAEAETDLSVYGLSTPVATLRVRARSGAVVGLQLGKENPYVQKRYLKIEDKPDIFMVSATLLPAIDRSPNDLRDKTPVPFFESQLASLSLLTSGKKAGADTSVQLESLNDGGWKIVQPTLYAASTAAMTELIRAIRMLEAVEFYDNPESRSRFGLTAPLVQIRATYKDSARAPFEASIGQGKDKGFFLEISGVPTAFRLKEDPTGKIIKDTDALRERQFTRLAIDQVEGFTIEAAGSSPVVIKSVSPSIWSVNDKPADTPFVEEYLRTLSGLTAVGFIKTPGETGASQPTLKVEVNFKEDSKRQPLRLVIGQRTKLGEQEGVFAWLVDSTEVFVISAKDFERLNKREEALATRPGATPPVGSSQGELAEEIPASDEGGELVEEPPSADPGEEARETGGVGVQHQ